MAEDKQAADDTSRLSVRRGNGPAVCLRGVRHLQRVDRSLRRPYDLAVTEPLLSRDIAIPIPPEHADMVLEPLGEEHNLSDLDAWGSSIEHIRSTPGMGDRDWPPEGPYTVEQNLADMRMHVADFAARTGFTWTVLDPASRAVIGCVYMYPSEVAGSPPGQITVRSWVRADRSTLDAELYRLVSAWIARDWPWADVVYAHR